MPDLDVEVGEDLLSDGPDEWDGRLAECGPDGGGADGRRKERRDPFGVVGLEDAGLDAVTDHRGDALAVGLHQRQERFL